MIEVGTVPIGCGQCDTVVQVPVTADLQPNDDGDQELVCTPDLTDAWAHAWTHDPDVNAEETPDVH
jgi:hypothetical protein